MQTLTFPHGFFLTGEISTTSMLYSVVRYKKNNTVELRKNWKKNCVGIRKNANFVYVCKHVK